MIYRDDELAKANGQIASLGREKAVLLKDNERQREVIGSLQEKPPSTSRMRNSIIHNIIIGGAFFLPVVLSLLVGGVYLTLLPVFFQDVVETRAQGVCITSHSNLQIIRVEEEEIVVSFPYKNRHIIPLRPVPTSWHTFCQVEVFPMEFDLQPTTL